MSLIRCSSILLAAWMFIASSATSSEISSRRIISLRPTIVLIGVRISWLMLEKNWFCALFSLSISRSCCRESAISSLKERTA